MTQTRTHIGIALAWLQRIGGGKFCLAKATFSTIILVLFLALSSCSSSEDEDDLPTTSSLSSADTSAVQTISFSDLQGRWLWTSTFNPVSQIFFGTWADSYCEITPDSIRFYHAVKTLNLDTGEHGLRYETDEQYPVRYSPPNILQFNNQVFHVLPQKDGGYFIKGEEKGYVIAPQAPQMGEM